MAFRRDPSAQVSYEKKKVKECSIVNYVAKGDDGVDFVIVALFLASIQLLVFKLQISERPCVRI